MTEIFLTVEDGKISDFKKKELVHAIKSYSGRVKITVEKARSKRSVNQNAYFHGVVIPMIASKLIDMGFNEAKSKDWTKDFIKYNCLLKEAVSEKTGEVIKSLGRTSGLTKSEFMDFVSEVQQWAAEKLDLYIPDPNEQTQINYD